MQHERNSDAYFNIMYSFLNKHKYDWQKYAHFTILKFTSDLKVTFILNSIVSEFVFIGQKIKERNSTTESLISN